MGNNLALCDKTTLAVGCNDAHTVQGSIKLNDANFQDIIFNEWSNTVSVGPLPKAPYAKQMSQIIATFESWLRDGVGMMDPPNLGVLEVATLASSFASAVSTKVNRLCQEHPQVRFAEIRDIWDEYPALRECQDDARGLLLAVLRYITLIAIVKAAFRTCNREVTEDEVNDCTSKFIAIESSNLCSSVKEWIETWLPGSTAHFYAFKDERTIIDLSIVGKTNEELRKSDVPACEAPYDIITSAMQGGQVVSIPFSGKTADDIIGVCELHHKIEITDTDHWMADAFLREFSFVLEKARIATIIIQSNEPSFSEIRQHYVAVSTS